MNAVLELIWKGSYGAVTIDDICRAAEVKKGSFYYFFQSKSELTVAALDRLWTETWRPEMDAEFSPTVEPLQRLTNYLEKIYLKQVEAKEKFGRVLGCPVCSVGSETAAQDDALGAKVREICSQKRLYFESALRDAVAAGAIEPCDPAQKLDGLVGLVEGTMNQARIMNDPDVLRRLPRIALDYLRAKEKFMAQIHD